jgi:sulfoquinovosyltransferase
MWALIRFWTRAADVMLVTSSVMATELAKNACRDSAIALWRRGVDVDIFNPAFRSDAAREMLSAGNPAAPLLVYVGRLGAEKNLTILKGTSCLHTVCGCLY